MHKHIENNVLQKGNVNKMCEPLSPFSTQHSNMYSHMGLGRWTSQDRDAVTLVYLKLVFTVQNKCKNCSTNETQNLQKYTYLNSSVEA